MSHLITSKPSHPSDWTTEIICSHPLATTIHWARVIIHTHTRTHINTYTWERFGKKANFGTQGQPNVNFSNQPSDIVIFMFKHYVLKLGWLVFFWFIHMSQRCSYVNSMVVTKICVCVCLKEYKSITQSLWSSAWKSWYPTVGL